MSRGRRRKPLCESCELRDATTVVTVGGGEFRVCLGCAPVSLSIDASGPRLDVVTAAAALEWLPGRGWVDVSLDEAARIRVLAARADAEQVAS